MAEPERNPYEPPKARVSDVVQPPRRLPRFVRVLRALAITGSVFAALFALVTPFAAVSLTLPLILLALLLFVLATTSIAALVSKSAQRRLYWIAMGSNAAAAVMLNLGGGTGVALLLIVPALLNMTAIELLRRARLVLDASANAP
jgi:hypothetical protein